MATSTATGDPLVIASEEEALAAQQALDRFNNDKLAAQQAERATKLQPINDLLASDAFIEVKGALPGLCEQYYGEPFFDLLRAMSQLTTTLPTMVR